MDRQSAATELDVVESCYGSVGIGHFHEAVAPRLTRATASHQRDRIDLAVLPEEQTQLLLGRVAGQVAYIDSFQ